jgi:D-cysteine desulfhydrase
MTALDDRVDLGVRPTPVFDASAICPGLWVKDDGMSAELYGGNKPRKLEYLLHRAPRCIATMGARGSHHALATAVHGERCGHEVHVISFPRPANEHVEQVYEATSQRATMHQAGDVFDARAQLASLGAKGMQMIPAGGSSPIGALGFVRAGLELIQQIDAGECPMPSRVYVAMGTAGSLVGLTLAFNSVGLRIEVRGIRVVPEAWLTRSEVEQLAHETSSLAKMPFVMPTIDNRWLGEGYGAPTAQGVQAVGMASGVLHLESTYTGKTLAAACADATKGAALFWQTHNSHSIEGLLERRIGPKYTA